MFQLLYPCGQSLLFSAFCGLSRVLTSLILEASFAVSIGSQFLGKAPDSGITEDFGVNTIFLEDLAHGFAVDELAVCHALEFMGVKIDDELNRQAVRGAEGKISTPDSKVEVFVIPTNEELVIARDTMALVENNK